MNLTGMIMIGGLSIIFLVPSEERWVKTHFIAMLLVIMIGITDLKTDLAHLQSTCNFTKTDNNYWKVEGI